MSRELDLLAREFGKTPVTILRAELNLYQTNIKTAAAAFLRKLEQECKKKEQPTAIIIALIKK